MPLERRGPLLDNPPEMLLDALGFRAGERRHMVDRRVAAPRQRPAALLILEFTWRIEPPARRALWRRQIIDPEANSDSMNGTVLDILIYVFDRYMLDEAPEVPEREELARDLESAGFGEANVERALDWLADLAGERHRPALLDGQHHEGAEADAPPSLRVYTPHELTRLPVDCRGLLLSLEQVGILSAQQREIVIDRLLALDAEDFDIEQVKWVVLMVLSSQPGQEQACARMEDLVFDLPELAAH